MEKIELNKEISSLINKVKIKFDKMNAENNPASDPWLILTEVEMLYQKLVVLKYVHETERKKQKMENLANSEATEIEDVVDENLGKVIIDGTDEIKIETPESTIPKATKVAETGDLKKLIGFNEKILFTKELFHKDSTGYDTAIADLNQCKNVVEAEAYIKINVVEKGKLERDNEILEIFLSLVKRRFA